MNCPHCKDAQLVMSERAGVEIDYCPSCRGVWLDRGELDKIIERAAEIDHRAGGAVAAPPIHQQAPPPPPQYYGRKPDDSHYGYPSPHGYKKRKNWLSELFD
jgi:Zn-finger nucleic acid-binding protein